ncbi:MAG: PEP-CTERM sorting domain-containing protein [Deltaproteobacteria bacterium]|nr:PEP-CTERM sorting domain-containing protein [Deltaproteobacteria bacterium]
MYKAGSPSNNPGTYSSVTSFSNLPEPGTMILFGFGLISFIGARRKS